MAVVSNVAQRPAAPAASPPSQGRLSRFRAWFLQRSTGLIYLVTLFLGLIELFGALDEHQRFRVHAIMKAIPIPASAAATAITAVAGVLLLRLAAALRKHKRRAWRAAVGITAIVTVAHVVRGVHVVTAVISFVLFLMLVAARSRFTAKSDPRTRLFAVRVFFQLMIVSVVFGMTMLFTYRHRVIGHPSFWLQLKEIFASMIGTGGFIKVRGERFDDIFHGTHRAAVRRRRGRDPRPAREAGPP